MTNEPRGIKVNTPAALAGYTLIAPLQGKTVNLVDHDGHVVHRWKTEFKPGCEYFLQNGHLLRCSQQPEAPRFKAGGQCGRIQEFDWDGNVVWDYTWSTDEHLQHHDLEPTPHGTVLFISYEYKSRADAVAAGRHPAYVGEEGMWAEAIFEVEPTYPSGGEIIWEWHVWDHLIQDIDPDAENYGNVAEHPELLDINVDIRQPQPGAKEVEEMKALGYIDATPSSGQLHADWLHVNAIDYHPGLDQIAISTPHLSEVFILDHSTTGDEATGHDGGLSNQGGDFLWRWGNPANYGAGSAADRQLWSQHDVRWVLDGFPGAGHLTIFNNRVPGPAGDHSEIFELALPRAADGSFGLEPFVAAGPAQPAWRYASPDPKEFFSSFISGAHRVQNGNTVICEGHKGRIFEVTPDGTIAWDLLSPFGEIDPTGQSGPLLPYSLFRATRIAADHPGLKGKRLVPLE